MVKQFLPVIAIGVIAVVVLGIVRLVQALTKSSRSKHADKRGARPAIPYTRRQPGPLTKGERAFFLALHAAGVGRHHIFAKVNLADIGTHKYRGERNRISTRHVDFLVCDLHNVSPFLAIELDDQTHRERDAAYADKLKDRFFREIGLPLMRIRAQAAYDIGELRRIIGAPTSK